MYECLNLFAEPTRNWFTSAFGEPTPAQRQAWPAIASGSNVLVVAPTGSGKTLAAFLSAIDGLMQAGRPATGTANTDQKRPARRHGVTVLYISPLKALAVDVAKNLTAPLDGIRRECERQGVPAPHITVATRSGDTTPRERRAIASHPPDILVTTPESLYLLLTSKAGAILTHVRTVILDEVHALAGSKRGAHLAVSLERLETMNAKPLQRIGLSATVRPAEQAARFLAGGRPVTIVEPAVPTAMDLTVVDSQDHAVTTGAGKPGDDGFDKGAIGSVSNPNSDPDGGPDSDPDSDTDGDADRSRGSVWPAIERSVLDEVLRHHTTLVFVNSRGLAEKLTARLNDRYAASISGHPPNQRYGGIPHYEAVVGSTGALVGSHDAEESIAMAHHGSVSKDRRKRIEEDLKHGRLRCVVATSSLELGIDMGSVDLVIQIAPPLSVSSGLQRVGRADHRVGGVSHAMFYPLIPEHLIAMGSTIEAMRAGEIEPLAVLRNPLDVLAQQTVAAAAMHELDSDDWYAVVRRSAPFAQLDRTSFDAVVDMLTGGYNTEEFSAFRPPLAWDRERHVITARPGAQRLAVTSGGTIPDRGQYAVVIPEAEGESGPRRVGELDEEMVYESRVGDVITLGTSTWRIREITHDRVVVVPAPGATSRLPFWHGDGVGRDAGFGEISGRFVRDMVRGLLPAAEGVPAHFDEAAELRLRDDGMDGRSCEDLASLLDRQRSATGVVPDDHEFVIERCLDEQDDWRVILHSPYGRRVHEPWALAISHRLNAQYGFDGQCYAADDGIVVHIPSAQEELSDADIFLFDAEELRHDVEEQVGDSVLFAARFRECAARSLYMPRTRPGKRVPLWQQRLRASQLLAAAKTRRNFPLILETARECLQDVYDMPALTRVMRRIASGDIVLHAARTDTPSPFADSLLFGFVGDVMYQSDSPQAERSASLLSMDMGALERLIGTEHITEVLDPDSIREVEENLGRITFWNQLDDEDIDGRIQRFCKTHGPFTADELISALNIDATHAVHTLDALHAKGDLLVGRFTPDADTTQYLLRDVFRRIRNRSLDRARRAVRPVDRATYQRFVMNRQGVGPVGAERLTGAEGLLRVIEQFEGVSLPASVWEDAVFPSRVRDYEPMMLDAALASGEVLWVGSSPTSAPVDGTGTIAWYLADSPLLGVPRAPQGADREQPAVSTPSATQSSATADGLAQTMLRVLQPGGAFPAHRLFERCRDIIAADDGKDSDGKDSEVEDPSVNTLTGEVVDRYRGQAPNEEDYSRTLWSLVWQGSVTNSSFAPIRALRRGSARQHGSVTRRTRSLPMRSSMRSSMRASIRSSMHTAMRHRAQPQLGGLWSAVPSRTGTAEQTLIALVEALLDRYGVVAQPIVDKEAIPGGFTHLYPVLTSMENAGVLLRGVFVEGLSAAQFASRRTVDALREARAQRRRNDEDSSHEQEHEQEHEQTETEQEQADTVSLDALDPANLAGWAWPWPHGGGNCDIRPSHRAGNMVVFTGGTPVLFAAPSSHHLLAFGDQLAPAFEQLARCLSRSRRASTTFHDLDGSPFDIRNPYTPMLREAGFTPGSQGMTLYR